MSVTDAQHACSSALPAAAATPRAFITPRRQSSFPFFLIPFIPVLRTWVDREQLRWVVAAGGWLQRVGGCSGWVVAAGGWLQRELPRVRDPPQWNRVVVRAG